MERKKITEQLDQLAIKYSITEHPPAFTMEDMDSFQLENGEFILKNLFLRDDKKRNYYLVSLGKDKSVNLKELRKTLGSRPLTFASEKDLLQYLQLTKGAVTPFGILNDSEHQVQVILDEAVRNFPVLGIHPNQNTATLWLEPAALVQLIEKQGNPVSWQRI